MKKIFKFYNSYSKLPKSFYEKTIPKPVKDPTLIYVNEDLLNFLNLDAKFMKSIEAQSVFSGNRIPSGAEPISLAYAGHQFGHFVPVLGDGRAILLGEIYASDKTKKDVQLKGSGQTVFSRNGDGRAPLGAILREYLISEALHFLDIPSTRVLTVVNSGEYIKRQVLTKSGILTRISSGHVRVGTFEYFAYRKDYKSVRILTDYVIKRNFPDIQSSKKKIYNFLHRVMTLQAKLVAKWTNNGFIHGVINTDNVLVCGETIDYGPCAFMDHYNPQQVYSYIDVNGRYSYANQSKITLWNLSKLGECLVKIINDDEKKSVSLIINVLEQYSEKFNSYLLKGLKNKMGMNISKEGDKKLFNEFLLILYKENVDYTQAFRYLSSILIDPKNEKKFLFLFRNKSIAKNWLNKWKNRILFEKSSPIKISTKMQLCNPCYIPRNHVVDKAIKLIELKNDYSLFDQVLTLIKEPFLEKENGTFLFMPPSKKEKIKNTFCGT